MFDHQESNGGNVMERDFKVVGKGLAGQDEKPQITMKSDQNDKLVLNLDSKKELSDYQMEQILTVKILREQTTLGR